MTVIQAECGETIFDFLTRINSLSHYNKEILVARHNDIDVRVYLSSALSDLFDKYDMQVKIIRLQQGT